MATLNYWDKRAGEWVPVAGMHLDDAWLRVTGGRMTGPLVVEGSLTTSGYVHAGFIVGQDAASAIDADIVMREDRYAYFGHSEIVGLADPVDGRDLATHGYLGAESSASQDVVPLVPGAGWEDYGAEMGPLQARQAGDGMVTIQGSVRATAAIRPGPASPPIAVLPEAMRPASRKVFPVAGATISKIVRVDIFPGGEIRAVSAAPSIVPGFWVALHDVCYYPS